jgi:hypothetical protein
MGYAIHWTAGDPRVALKYFVEAIIMYPFDLKLWRTLVSSIFQIISGRSPKRA